MKSIHEQIGITTELRVVTKKDLPQDKKTILDALKEIAFSGSGNARYSAPAHIDIGIGVISSMKRTYEVLGPNIVISETTEKMNEIQRDYKDVYCKRLIFELFEAATLQRVTVKLLVDFDQFLALQRKLPSEYTDKRLGFCIPIEKFDDDQLEADVIHHVIRTRRLARLEPLKIEFFRRDTVNHLKIAVKGSLLDYDPHTKRYLVEESCKEKTLYFTRRLSI